MKDPVVPADEFSRIACYCAASRAKPSRRRKPQTNPGRAGTSPIEPNVPSEGFLRRPLKRFG